MPVRANGRPGAATDDLRLRAGMPVAGLALLVGSLITTRGSGLGVVPAFLAILGTDASMVMLATLLGRRRDRPSLMDLGVGLSCLNLGAGLFAWQRLAGVSHVAGAVLLIVAAFVGVLGFGVTWSGGHTLRTERTLLATPGRSPRTQPTRPQHAPTPLSPAEQWAMALGLAAALAATGACLWAGLLAQTPPMGPTSASPWPRTTSSPLVTPTHLHGVGRGVAHQS
jgi:hypothetical protein